MNVEERNKHIEKIFRDCMNIMNSKGRDYAGTEDVLRNFKLGSKVLKISPRQVLGVYVFKPALPIIRCLLGEPIHSEPIEERIKDVINYLLLLYCMLVEEGVIKEKESKDDGVQIKKYADGSTLWVKDGIVIKEDSY